MNRINKNVKYLRESRNKTKIWVADQIGKTETAVRSYETGKATPPAHVLEMYAKVFDVYIGDIVGQDMWEGESRPPDNVGQLKELERVQREKQLLHDAIDVQAKRIDEITAKVKDLRAEIGEISPDHPLFGRIMELLKAAESE